MRTILATLTLLALPACAALWPTEAAERLTTVQFLCPEQDSECVILRAHGDRVVVCFLTDRPRPEGLPDFLAGRGLSTVDEVVFTVTPRQPTRFPDSVLWHRFRCPAAAEAVVRASLVDTTSAAAEVVTAETTVDLGIPGVDLRLVPTGEGGDRLLVDVRHAGNRVVLVPVAQTTEDDLRTAAAEAPIDLLGLLPPASVLDLRDVPGLQQSRFLVRGPLGVAASDWRAAIPLEERKRLLFQSAADGLVPLGASYDISRE